MKIGTNIVPVGWPRSDSFINNKMNKNEKIILLEINLDPKKKTFMCSIWNAYYKNGLFPKALVIYIMHLRIFLHLQKI